MPQEPALAVVMHRLRPSPFVRILMTGKKPPTVRADISKATSTVVTDYTRR